MKKIFYHSSLRVERSETTQPQRLRLLHYAGASFAMTNPQSNVTLRLKSQAHNPSPFKWTNDFFSPLQRTLALSPEINDPDGDE